MIHEAHTTKPAKRRPTMTRRHLAAGAAVVLGVMLSGVTTRTQSQPATQGAAVDGSPAWFLQGSFPDPTGRTIVDASGRVTIPPRGNGPGPAPAAASASAVVPASGAVPPPIGRHRRDAAMPSIAAVWQTIGHQPPVTAACAVAADDGLHVHVSIRVAARIWRCACRRARLEEQPVGVSTRGSRKAAVVQVRCEPQTDSPGRPRRHRLSGQGARHGRRSGRQRLDHSGEQRHGDEDRSRWKAAADDWRTGSQRRLG